MLMSQRAFEAALGRLVCDDAFRKAFYEADDSAVLRAGFDLTCVELSSLHAIKVEAIEAFASHVDDRVRRAEEPSPPHRQL